MHAPVYRHRIRPRRPATGYIVAGALLLAIGLGLFGNSSRRDYGWMVWVGLPLLIVGLTSVGRSAPTSRRREPVAVDNCPACPTSRARGAEFCADCGTPVGTVARCLSCGQINSAAATYCRNCGTQRR